MRTIEYFFWLVETAPILKAIIILSMGIFSTVYMVKLRLGHILMYSILLGAAKLAAFVASFIDAAYRIALVLPFCVIRIVEVEHMHSMWVVQYLYNWLYTRIFP